MSEGEKNISVYELVPALTIEYIGQHRLLAVIFGGSYADHAFVPEADIDADLLFQKLNTGYATTLVNEMKKKFSQHALTLDVRTCVDLSGKALYLHQKGGIPRPPIEGTVNLATLHQNNHIVVPLGFNLNAHSKK